MSVLNMAAGDVNLDASGNVTLNSTGDLVDDCAGCPGTNCATGCNTGTTPNSWKASWSGINICIGACVIVGGTLTSNYGKITGTTAATSGTSLVSLGQINFSPFCFWQAAAAVSLAGDTASSYGTSSTCAGSPDSTFGPPLQLRIFLIKNTNKWATGIDIGFNFGGSGEAFPIFYSEIAVSDPIDCNPASLSFSNGYTGCNQIISTGAELGSAGYDGTLVLTPCF